MSQPKDWLYCLTDEQGRSYYVNNGVVQLSGVPKPLRYTPDGWQDKSIKYARNVTSMGMWRTFTTPLKYVKDAAFIVRNQLYKKGTEEKIYQVIHRLNKKFGGAWSYDFFYKGELDLTQVEDTDSSIQVNIMEGDLIKLFKANENTTYEIDIDVPDAVAVKMDGLDLHRSGSFAVVDGTEIKKSVYGTNFFLPVAFINSEGQSAGINFVAQALENVTGQPFDDKKNSDNILANADQFNTGPVQLNITGVLKFKCTVNDPGLGFRVRFLTNTQTIVNQNDYMIFEFGPSPGNSYQFTINETINLQPGEKLHLEGIFFGGITGSIDIGIEFLEGSDLSISYVNRYRTTYIKGLRPLYVAQKLLDKITGGGYSVSSSYLSNEWENLIITSGDGIRAYDNSGSLITGFKPPKIKISWADFYDSYNVPCNLSQGIRSQALFIEKKEAVFQPTIQQNMGEVTGLGITTAKDFQYNVVKIGYPNTDTNDLNGKDEFNVTYTYTSPITRVNKSLDLVSKVIASMYEIEITRINLDGKPTTDDDNDNRLFFIHVEKTPTSGVVGEPAVYYKLLRNTYTSISGLISPSTAFNLELHPELCLYRHGNFLRSVFYWQDAKNLVYQTSDKNGNVVVMNGSTTYIGNKNIRIGSLAAPLFIPLTFKFKSPMPDDFITTMDNGPDGTFSFTYDGVPYYGFPMDVGIQPANRPAQESTLLCSPQTDLTKLITMSR